MSQNPKHFMSNMLNLKGHRCRTSMVLLFLFILLGQATIFIQPVPAQDQTKWSALPEIDTLTSPAVCEHSDGQIYVASIAFSGIVGFTSSATPDGWKPWEIIGPQPATGFNDPAFYAAPNTKPVLLHSSPYLYLLVRGKNDNLYETHKEGNGNWSDWQQLTFDGMVAGRISAVITKPEGMVNPLAINETYLHVMYTSVEETVKYQRFLIKPGNWSPSGNLEQWSNALEGTIGTNGTTQILGMIRTNNRQLIGHKKIVPWNASWKSILTLNAEGPQGDFFDLSNIVHFAGAFHIAYAKKLRSDDVSPNYSYHIEHFRIPIGQQAEGYFISNYDPAVADPPGISHPETELAVYRNKLVMAYRDPTGWVRYARWDNADPQAPWLGTAIVDASHRTKHRPSLGVFHNRSNLSGADFGQSNFGDDLIAAITEIDTNSILYVNFSRALFSMEISTQFDAYDSNSDGESVVCRPQNDPLAPTIIADIGADGRPFFTELGYVLWTFPNWYIGNLYATAGRLGCEANNTSGRFAPPCESAKYPVILRSGGGAFICSGIWVWQGEIYSWNIFHELAHSMAGMLGFSDDGSQTPTSDNALNTGISLSALTSGYTLFGLQVNSDCLSNEADDTCSNTRETGFTGYANNYDVSTRQHSFIGALYYYFFDGAQFRQWIKDDGAAGSKLLGQKYSWIKQNIFKGLEFEQNNLPFNQVMPPPNTQEFYFYEPTFAYRKSATPSMARPVGVGSIAEGESTLSLELGTLEFEDNVDIYLALYLPALDANNIYLIQSDLTIQPASAGVTPWRSNTVGPIDFGLFGDLPLSGLTGFGGFIGFLVTPPGDLTKNYFWVTSFLVP